MILIFGTMLSFLLSFIAYSLSSARKKALILVEEKTAEIISKEAFLLLILNSTAEAIYGIDTNGNCTFCNKACLDLLGYEKPEELIGKNMHLMIHHSYADGLTYPVELCPIVDAFRKKMHSHCDREVLWRKDGTSFAAEYWSHPQYKNGELIGCVVTFIDIGARKKAQDELREVSDRLILATKAGQVGVWDYNINNNVLRYDDQMFALYGIRPSDFDGKYETWLMSLHPEDLKKINEEVKLAIEGVKYFNTEFRVVWPDNSIHNIRAMGMVKKDEKGKPFSMIGTNWDITDQKRIEEQAKMASKAKSEFLANMTHELRTPMTGVIGMTTLLLRSKLDEAQKRYTQGIVTCGQSLMKLINDILDFSKIEAKKLKLDSIDFNLKEILSPVISSFSLQAQEKGLQFSFNLSPQVPILLNGDSFRIIQIFNNLIANAINLQLRETLMLISPLSNKKCKMLGFIFLLRIQALVFLIPLGPFFSKNLPK
jgi:PAS domain S-box-containing protein